MSVLYELNESDRAYVVVELCATFGIDVNQCKEHQVQGDKNKLQTNRNKKKFSFIKAEGKCKCKTERMNGTHARLHKNEIEIYVYVFFILLYFSTIKSITNGCVDRFIFCFCSFLAHLMIYLPSNP